MSGKKVWLTLHVVLQLDKIHRSQRSLCVIRRGHVDQLYEQRRDSEETVQIRQGGEGRGQSQHDVQTEKKDTAPVTLQV